MAKQRNNIVRMPFDVREIVCRMLFEGATYDEVRAAIEHLTDVTAHNSSLLAYSESHEYRRYVEFRRQWQRDLERDRWAASMLNDGQGPQSLADVAEYEILQQLHELAKGGLLETGKDVATVARAITSLQRTQLARAEAERKGELRKFRDMVDELTAENRRLRDAVESAGVNVESGRQEVDLAKISAKMDELLGG